MDLVLTIPRIAQIDDFHCGPAVIQMCLAYFGIETTQVQIDQAAGIRKSIYKAGSRTDQLSEAVSKITHNQYHLWYKDHSRLADVARIINRYHYPVVIEWQGLFGYKIDPKTNGPLAVNDGHYSIISSINSQTKDVTLLDPYKDFVHQDRVFKYSQFRKRWWDSNIVNNNSVYDYKLFFFVAPADVKFPASLGLKSGRQYQESLPL